MHMTSIMTLALELAPGISITFTAGPLNWRLNQSPYIVLDPSCANLNISLMHKACPAPGSWLKCPKYLSNLKETISSLILFTKNYFVLLAQWREGSTCAKSLWWSIRSIGWLLQMEHNRTVQCKKYLKYNTVVLRVNLQTFIRFTQWYSNIMKDITHAYDYIQYNCAGVDTDRLRWVLKVFGPLRLQGFFWVMSLCTY